MRTALAGALRFERNPRILYAAAVAIFALCWWTIAFAEFSFAQDGQYPNRPITLVVPYGAGGSGDVTARIVADRLSKVVGQPVVVDNKPGIVTGTSFLAAAAPDGYHLLATPLAHSVNPTLYKQLPYDLFGDFTPIATLGFFNFVLVVNPKLPVTDLRSLIAFLKAAPGKYNYGSGGTGTTSRIGVEFFKSLTGTEITHVPYRGDGQALVDLLAGRIALMLCSAPACLPDIARGALRPLAITSSHRSPLLPNVPTAAEAGLPEFKVMAYYAIQGPKNTPAAVVATLNKAVNETLGDKELQGRLSQLGFEVEQGSTPASTAKLINDEAKKWAPIIKATGVVIQ